MHSGYALKIVEEEKEVKATGVFKMSIEKCKVIILILMPIILIFTFYLSARAQSWRKIAIDDELPMPRSHHTAVYDNQNHRMLIFGGKSEQGYLNDLWGFDLSAHTWTEIIPAGSFPKARSSHVAIHAKVEGKMFIFSGEANDPRFLEDTWAFDTSLNSWGDVSPVGQPFHRYGSAAIYDSGRQAMVIFGGIVYQARFDDSWSFNLLNYAWSDISPQDTKPVQRCVHAAVYRPLSDEMIIFGGTTNVSDYLGDLWAFNLTLQNWTKLASGENFPPPRALTAMIYQEDMDRLVIYGGVGSSLLNDTWVFDFTSMAWSQLSLTTNLPSPRFALSTIYDPIGKRMIIFGGQNDSTWYNETWELANLAAKGFSVAGKTLGVAHAGTGRGVAWGDFDNDGDQDLYLSSWFDPNFLYRNDLNPPSEERFTEVGKMLGVDNPGIENFGMAAAWGDYDNDGKLDLYVVNGTSFNPSNRLYHNEMNLNGNPLVAALKNQQDGAFVDVAEMLGVASPGNGASAAWADYDNDGDLDLYLANWNQANHLFRNNFSESQLNTPFTDVGAKFGLDDTGAAAGVAWGDYDNDGDLDLYLANEKVNRLYRNDLSEQGIPGFTEVAEIMGVADQGIGQGVAWADFDNDGDLDLYVANGGFFNAPNRLYRNDISEGSEAGFTPVGSSLNVEGNDRSFGCAWADYDNDGDLDLFVVNRYNPNRLYHNLLSETNIPGFTEVANTLGLAAVSSGQRAAWADYDNDGYLDLYVSNNEQQNFLYHNELSHASAGPNNWLVIKTIGTMSNRDGLGAQVRAVAGDLVQLREVSGGSGNGSQNSLPIEFGFGKSDLVDSLVIRWPSGIVQVFTNVAVNQKITVTEEVTTEVDEGDIPKSPKSFSLFQNYPNPFNPTTTITFEIPETAKVTVAVYNVAGQKVKTLLEQVLQAGEHGVIWDGLDSRDQEVGSGIYLYSVKTGNFSLSKKMILIR